MAFLPTAGATLQEQEVPAGRDAERAKRVIDQRAGMAEQGLIAEDEAAELSPDLATVAVPAGLVPAIRQPLAARKPTA